METRDEFRTPDFTSTDNVREFYMQYITKGQDCQYQETEEMCTDMNCPYQRKSNKWFTNEEVDDFGILLISLKHLTYVIC